MNRWRVTIPEGVLKYYANEKAEVEKAFPNATSIVPYDDTEFYSAYEAVRQHITKTIAPNFYEVHTMFGDFHYEQFVDAEGHILDGCKWRRTVGLYGKQPVLWDIGSVNEFYDKYLSTEYDTAKFGWTRTDYLEWGKIKKKGGFKVLKVSSPWKDQTKYWANAQGLVWEIDRQHSKKRWEEYKKNPAAFADTKPPFNPDLCQNCFRIPYAPILNMYIKSNDMARIWRERIAEEIRNNIKYRIFARAEVPYSIDFLESIIEETRSVFCN